MEKKLNKDVMLRIRVTEEENQLIEQLADKLNMNKSKLVRNIVLGNIDDVFDYTQLMHLPIFERILEESESMDKLNKIIHTLEKE